MRTGMLAIGRAQAELSGDPVVEGLHTSKWLTWHEVISSLPLLINTW